MVKTQEDTSVKQVNPLPKATHHQALETEENMAKIILLKIISSKIPHEENFLVVGR